ncbi:Glutathione S-transferase domain protein [Sphingobium chlorophenolicum L-1]|uniref:Glutathione S-transferase domain protein n=1 Tax=Sphingobium chlorophenolicum L-1 TaxID=690566 RepID=F6F296_SPHCR|nr:glutathione S-transferase N-terminal domain-containing protein [Sphingobium chlorophenolicum]AEG51626.1 Glutathione S-transferase domain protein [Sphingobium chlorophenolicum L-1]
MTIQLYTWGTPNGRKVSILLEELGVPYAVHPVNIMKDEQFAPEFLALNANNKIPVIVDPDGPDGKPLMLAESGAILIYLAQKFASPLWPTEPARQMQVLQWLMFQMGGLGPMMGQLHHFRRYATGESYSLARYEKEVHRLYGVLDGQLAQGPFIAGADYSIADIAAYPWVNRFELHGIAWDRIPNVRRWYDEVGARPAVVRGMDVPKL